MGAALSNSPTLRGVGGGALGEEDRRGCRRGISTGGGGAGGRGCPQTCPRGGWKPSAPPAPEPLPPGAAGAGCQRGFEGAPGSGPGRLQERSEGLLNVKICPRSRGITPPCRRRQPSNAISPRVGACGRRPVNPPTPRSGVREAVGNVENGSFESSSGGLGAGGSSCPNGPRGPCTFAAIYYVSCAGTLPAVPGLELRHRDGFLLSVLAF